MTQRHPPQPDTPASVPLSVRGLLLAACDVYTLPLIVYLTLRVLSGNRLWPVALASVFIHWLLLPAIPFLILMLLSRRWWRAALAGVNAVAFLWLFGGLFLPDLSPPPACSGPPDECLTLTVMTYNINDGNATPDRLIPLLRESGADIIALQEVSREQAAALEGALLEEYPYRVLYGYGIPGIGLLSRYPILDHELFDLVRGAFPYLEARLSVEGRTLRLINAHPPPPGVSLTLSLAYASQGIVDMPPLAERATSDGPTILAGDFNATDQSDDYAILAAAGLEDAHRTAGRGFGLTFPNGRRYRSLPLPRLVRIDYIWVTEEFRPRRAWVGADAGSDHRPVLAELVWGE